MSGNTAAPHKLGSGFETDLRVISDFLLSSRFFDSDYTLNHCIHFSDCHSTHVITKKHQNSPAVHIATPLH